MGGLDFSSLKPVDPSSAPSAAPAGLDLSSLKPAADWDPSAMPAHQDDLGGQFGAGLATGIPNALSGIAGAQERGRRMGVPLPGADVIAGMLEPVIDPLLGRQPIDTQNDKLIQEGLSKAHLNPNDYFSEPQSAGERIARMTGEGLVTSITPGAAAETGWARLSQLAKELAAGTFGGAASQAAVEVAPDNLKGAAALAAGLGGGLAGHTLASAPGKAIDLVKAGVEHVAPAFARTATDLAPEAAANTTAGKIAAKRLAGFASNPDEAAANIGNAEDFVPGSEPTSAQAAGDRGLLDFERTLARSDPKFKAALNDRVEQQSAARVAALEGIEDTGDIGAAVNFFRDRMRTLETHADTLYDRADRAAKGQYEGLGDRSAADVGEQARTAIAGRFKSMNAEASALWNSIDPDGKMHVATQPLVEATARIYGDMSPEERLSLSPSEKNVAAIIGNYDDTLPFQRFKDLRSEITRAMRESKSFANPNDRAYRRLSMLRDAVEQAVEKSVNEQFTADPALADQFVKQARDWYASRTAAEPAVPAAPGPVAPASPVRGAEPGAPEPAAVSGTLGDQGREPAPPTRDQGLPENAPAPVEAPALQPRSRETLPPGGGIEAIDPRDIGVDARRFQFKEGGDEAGVTDRLQGVERWDPRLAGTALVYRDKAGKNWVADGHQRMGLANRLIENGHPPFKVNAFVLDAKDGITDADARAIAAVKNIAEGTGTPIDAAKVLRAAKETGVDLPPLPPRSALVRDGEALAALSPEAFGMVINEVVPAAQGAIVGRMIKDPAAQEEAVRVLAKLKPDNARMAEMVVRDLINSGVEQMTKQGGLFGEEAFASSVVLERAKIADQALKLLKQDKKLFGTLVDEAERIEGAGNALNRDANATRLSTDEKANDLLTQLAFRAGPVSTELTRLARSLKAGDQTPHAAARDFLQAIRRAVESGVDTGDSAGGIGSRAAGEEAPLERDPNTKEMFQSAPPVGTPEFRRWFGDSKVVDESGAPLVVYHGTGASEIDQFKPGKIGTGADSGYYGRGYYFAPSEGLAADYGPHQHQVHLSVKKPFVWDLTTPELQDDTIRRVTALDPEAGAALKAGASNFNERVPLANRFTAALRKAGFDGVFIEAKGVDGMTLPHEIMVLDPTQIKSVNNRGTFDPKDPRILYQNKPKPWREGDMLGGFNTERGLEGLPQAVIPGTEVTDASRLQMAASKPLKGGEAPPPRGGLFDVNGREEEAKQGSLFQSSTGAPIRDTMAERFAAAGRPPEEAVAAGELVNAFYTTMADRLGKPVDELVAQHPLPQVRKGENAEDAPGLKQISPDQARALPYKTKMPTDPTFTRAVASTPGASIEPDGLRISLNRWQKVEQAGEESVRTGVFYLPEGSPAAKHYKGKTGYGGSQKMSGETLLKSPMFVKGATGGKAPEAAYDLLKGKGAYEAMRSDVLKATGYGRPDEEKIYNILEKYGADPDNAWAIIQNSKGGNLLPYAVQENIVAHAVRDAGHDSVVGYGVARDAEKTPSISEVFDVRETHYPETGEPGAVHPKFTDQNTLFQPAYHGTPHIFDKFDSSKIGTGEGAQAFGHGLYFAGKKGVAEYYRNALSGDALRFPDGSQFKVTNVGEVEAVTAKVMSMFDEKGLAAKESLIYEAFNQADTSVKGSTPLTAAIKALEDEQPSNQEQVDLLNQGVAYANPHARQNFKDTADAIAALKAIEPEIQMVKGRLLTVDIPHDNELLNWDKPLSEQPDAVKAKLEPFIANIAKVHEKYGATPEAARSTAMSLSGADFYGELSALRGGDTQASAALREAGIPGHRFLDQASRNPKALADAKGSLAVWETALKKNPDDAYIKGEVEARRAEVAKLEAEISHNYVIYDDSRVNVTNYEQPARGSIQFGDTGSIISMFKGADASTALHESGHHFLKMFKSMAEGPDAPSSIAADWRAAKAWWDKNANDVAKDGGEGVTSADVRKVLREGTTGDRMKDLAVDRGLHEQWARGLETYLRDGKAPNGALRAIFQQFKDWLTNIYRNAGDLGVKMSPEIRDVFDRMLASDKSRAAVPQMMDKAAAGRFAGATAATREIKDVFGAKPVKQILNRPGATYPYAMGTETVATNLFKPGAEGGDAIRNAMRAGAPKEAIEGAAVLSLKRAASKDGAIDPTKLSAWRQKHAEALRAVPELDRRVTDAGRATEALMDIGERRKAAIDEIQRSAVGKLLKVEDDADVASVLGRMLNKETAVRDMRSLAAEARRDPDAMAGLRRGLVEHMVSRLKTPKDALRADTFQRFLGKNAPALSQVLTPEQMQSLRAIAQDLKRASRDVRAPGGGSDTAENLASRSRYGLDEPSVMGQILRRAMASGAVGVAAHMAQGPIMGALSAAGSFLGGGVINAFREAGLRRVDDLVREAVLHPELMKALLLKAPKRVNAGSAVTMRHVLGRIAASNLAMSAARGQDENRRRSVGATAQGG